MYHVEPSAKALAEMRRRVRGFLGLGVTETLRGDVLLALDETVTNAIVHGGASRVIIHVGLLEDRLTATVRDSGQGFDLQRLVETWSPPADPEGGRGLYLTTRLMDSVVICAAGGTIVHMSRDLVPDGDRRRPECVWSAPRVARFAHR